MGRLSEIKTEIGALLSSITTTNGFSFNFGTINQPDEAKITAWPGGNIKIKSEIPVSDSGGLHGFDTCQIEIQIFGKMSAVYTIPIHSIDEEYDIIIPAIKKKFHATLGSLPLTGNAVLRYKGFRKLPSQSGNVLSPDKLFIDCEVTYNSNEATLS
jgi:hypothetical protein